MGKKTTQFVCDQCNTYKKENNHWWILDRGGILLRFFPLASLLILMKGQNIFFVENLVYLRIYRQY